jgi:transcriptional regulator with XRE-family HTH domain
MVDVSNYGQVLNGARVKRLRKERSLSQGELAQLAGTTQATISEIERNLRRVQYRTTRSLAAALGVKPRDVLRD